MDLLANSAPTPASVLQATIRIAYARSIDDEGRIANNIRIPGYPYITTRVQLSMTTNLFDFGYVLTLARASEEVMSVLQYRSLTIFDTFCLS